MPRQRAAGAAASAKARGGGLVQWPQRKSRREKSRREIAVEEEAGSGHGGGGGQMPAAWLRVGHIALPFFPRSPARPADSAAPWPHAAMPAAVAPDAVQRASAPLRTSCGVYLMRTPPCGVTSSGTSARVSITGNAIWGPHSQGERHAWSAASSLSTALFTVAWLPLRIASASSSAWLTSCAQRRGHSSPQQVTRRYNTHGPAKHRCAGRVRRGGDQHAWRRKHMQHMKQPLRLSPPLACTRAGGTEATRH